MNNIRYILLIILLPFTTTLLGQAPAIQWKKCYGGTEDDAGYSIRELSDGGFYIAGYTASHNYDAQSNTGNFEHFWLIRTDNAGNILWENSYGGTWGPDIAYNMQVTDDGGAILVGLAYSGDGDVVGQHGAAPDLWVVKTDSLGVLQWQKCLGGTNYEYEGKIKPTSDGGYIVIGTTNSTSNSGDVSFSHGANDIWLVKLDSIGNIEWEKTFGGSAYDFGSDVIELNNSQFVICGSTDSNNGDITNPLGAQDMWVIRIDTSRNIVWQNTFGGSDGEVSASLYHNLHNETVIVGGSASINGNIVNPHGNYDVIRLSLNDSVLVSSYCYGGTDADWANSVALTHDFGSIISGMATSGDAPTSCVNTFLENYYILKTDSIGNYNWSLCIGGTESDVANDAIETSDGGYIVVGVTESNDGDVSGNHGGKDIWVVKLAPAGVNVPELSAAITDFTAFENSNGALHLNFSAEVPASLKLSLLDLTGREVYSENYSCIGGMNSHSTSTLSLSPGIYVLQLLDGEGMMVKKVFVNGGN